jgi:hypothetical protein
MHIDSYDFGRIVIDGVPYSQDLLIWPGHIKKDWWRQESHLLQLPDIFEVLDADPQVLVVGKGQPGRLQVDSELSAFLKDRGIELVELPTRQAVQVINAQAGKRRLAAALHLTC